MKIKIVCKVEDYNILRKIFADNGIEESSSPTHILYDANFLNKKIQIRTISSEMVFVNVKEILFVESFGNIIEIHTKSGILKTKKKLKSFLNERLLTDIVQINKSQLVSISHINTIKPLLNSKLKITLDNGQHIYVSRTYKSKFRNKIIAMEERYEN
jgi:DNA-binding LytR/AlgR family response regulator